MKIGILGSGDVARTLAGGFLKHGHHVMLGTRSPDKLADWSKQNPGSRVGSFAESADYAELAVLAVKGSITLDVLHAAGKDNERFRNIQKECCISNGCYQILSLSSHRPCLAYRPPQLRM